MTHDTKNQSSVKIAVLGGDLRQLTAANELTRHGFPLSLYGFDTYGDKGRVTLKEALADAAVAVLPVPALRGDCLQLPFSNDRITEGELIAALSESRPLKLVIGGKLSTELKETLLSAGIASYDLCEDDTFNLLNAVPTAEGALAIAMSHTPVTIADSHIGVLGYGRIGHYLCRLLTALGATVTVAARKEKDRTEAELSGCRACDYTALPSHVPAFDLLCNTVPATVVTDEVLAAMKPSACILDLASKPGGVDTACALRRERQVISALSLPGKVAPVTAGRIIARCVLETLEREVPL